MIRTLRYWPLRIWVLGVLVGLIGCATPHDNSGWPVYGGTPEQEEQAHGLVAAAKVVTGDVGGRLAEGGWIDITSDPKWFPPGVQGLCTFETGEITILATPETDLVHHSALPHELCHLGLSTGDEYRAQMCMAQVISTYDEASFDRGVFQ